MIQVGADNDSSHPHDEVLEQLAARSVLRNDLHGRVHVMSDGRQMWVETEKGSVTSAVQTPVADSAPVVEC